MRFLNPLKYLHSAKCLLTNKIYREDIYPFYASFKLTSRCHFACEFCNIKDEQIPDMTTEKAKLILDNLSDSSTLLVSFEGGEPLLRDDIGELLEYASKKNFYLLFTTSERKLETYPMKEYCKYIDFLHISMDEGHNNLFMYDRIEEFIGYGASLSVQVVVTKETLPALGEKVKRCYELGANMVIMPAVHMDRTDDKFPELDEFQKAIQDLKKLYPSVIYTPNGFFDAVKTGNCSTGSVIINSDGNLWYPCHILETKGPDLSKTNLDTWLNTQEAKNARKTMKNCNRKCGWFQYFAIPDFTSIKSIYRALRPAIK